MTEKQKALLALQQKRVDRLWSYVCDVQDGQPLNPNWSTSSELYDEFHEAQTFLNGMLSMVEIPPDSLT